MANLLGGLQKLLGGVANARNKAIGNVVGGVQDYFNPVTRLLPRQTIIRPTQYNPGQPPPLRRRIF